MVESSRSHQRRPPCKTNKGTSDEDADTAALTYLLTLNSTLLSRRRHAPATSPNSSTYTAFLSQTIGSGEKDVLVLFPRHPAGFDVENRNQGSEYSKNRMWIESMNNLKSSVTQKGCR